MTDKRQKMEQPAIRVTLEVRDGDGNVVDTTYQDLSEDAVLDVIHQAIEVIEAKRGGNANAIQWSEGELEDALVSYSLIEEQK